MIEVESPSNYQIETNIQPLSTEKANLSNISHPDYRSFLREYNQNAGSNRLINVWHGKNAYTKFIAWASGQSDNFSDNELKTLNKITNIISSSLGNIEISTNSPENPTRHSFSNESKGQTVTPPGSYQISNSKGKIPTNERQRPSLKGKRETRSRTDQKPKVTTKMQLEEITHRIKDYPVTVDLTDIAQKTQGNKIFNKPLSELRKAGYTRKGGTWIFDLNQKKQILSNNILSKFDIENVKAEKAEEKRKEKAEKEAKIEKEWNTIMSEIDRAINLFRKEALTFGKIYPKNTTRLRNEVGCDVQYDPKKKKTTVIFPGRIDKYPTIDELPTFLNTLLPLEGQYTLKEKLQYVVRFYSKEPRYVDFLEEYVNKIGMQNVLKQMNANTTRRALDEFVDALKPDNTPVKGIKSHLSLIIRCLAMLPYNDLVVDGEFYVSPLFKKEEAHTLYFNVPAEEFEKHGLNLLRKWPYIFAGCFGNQVNIPEMVKKSKDKRHWDTRAHLVLGGYMKCDNQIIFHANPQLSYQLMQKYKYDFKFSVNGQVLLKKVIDQLSSHLSPHFWTLAKQASLLLKSGESFKIVEEHANEKIWYLMGRLALEGSVKCNNQIIFNTTSSKSCQLMKEYHYDHSFTSKVTLNPGESQDMTLLQKVVWKLSLSYTHKSYSFDKKSLLTQAVYLLKAGATIADQKLVGHYKINMSGSPSATSKPIMGGIGPYSYSERYEGDNEYGMTYFFRIRDVIRGIESLLKNGETAQGIIDSIHKTMKWWY